MREIKCLSKEESDKKTAAIIVQSILNLSKTKSHFVLGICGGRSVSGVFAILKKSLLPWKKIHIFMVDERLVPITDPESNFKLAKDIFLGELVKRGELPLANLHPFKVEKGIEAYQKELEKVGEIFDLVLLSSGEDGHVAGLFPNRSVKNNDLFFITMNDAPKLPQQRMSASRTLLEKSQVGIVLFYGEAKRSALQKFKDKNTTVMECPAKVVLKMFDSYAITDLSFV